MWRDQAIHQTCEIRSVAHGPKIVIKLFALINRSWRIPFRLKKKERSEPFATFPPKILDHIYQGEDVRFFFRAEGKNF